jgi:hypothetical protein
MRLTSALLWVAGLTALTLAMPLQASAPMDRDSLTPQQSGARPPGPGFAFTATGPDGVPGRWDSCRPVRVLINPRNAPEGSIRGIRLALARMSQWTGLRLELVGTTSAEAGPDWGSRASGAVWPPVLISFPARSARGLSDTSASAEARPVWVTHASGRAEFVSGSITVNTAHGHLYGTGSDGRPSWARLLEHELGHVVGLDHVADRRSLMYPQVQPSSRLTRGDHIGLRRVGGHCAHAGRP